MTTPDTRRSDDNRADLGDRPAPGDRPNPGAAGLRRNTWFLLGGLLLSLLLAGLVSNFASASPDGLDSASTRGCTTDADGEITGGACMAANAKDHELGESPLADYGLRGVDNPYLATAAAGAAGVLVTFAVAGGLFWLARARRPAGGRGAGAAGRGSGAAATGRG